MKFRANCGEIVSDSAFSRAAVVTSVSDGAKTTANYMYSAVVCFSLYMYACSGDSAYRVSVSIPVPIIDVL